MSMLGDISGNFSLPAGRAYFAKYLAKSSKVGEEAVSCCNHSKNPGEGEGVGRCYAVYLARCLLVPPTQADSSQSCGPVLGHVPHKAARGTIHMPPAFQHADDSEGTMQATKAWAEANQLEPCECEVVDGTIVMIVYTVGFLVSRSRKLEAVASPARRSPHR